MKKIFVIALALICITLTGCGNGKDLVEISYDELATKIENEESFVLYVGSSECSHCADYKPTLEKIIYENKLDVYYINLAKLSDAKRKAVLDKAEAEGTPMTVYIEKGKTKSEPRVEGARDYDTTLEFFKELGLVEGE